MKELLPIFVLLACPLGMLAMGAAAWLSAKIIPGRRQRATSEPTGAE